MPKVKIDKKALKQNDLEIAIQQFLDYVKTNPKKVYIPIGIIGGCMLRRNYPLTAIPTFR